MKTSNSRLFGVSAALFTLAGSAFNSSVAHAEVMRLVYSQALPSSVSMENMGAPPICLGEGWKDVIPTFADRMSRMKSRAADAFVSIPGHEADYCLDPSKIPADMVTTFEAIMADIKTASPQTALALNHSEVESDAAQASVHHSSGCFSSGSVSDKTPAEVAPVDCSSGIPEVTEVSRDEIVPSSVVVAATPAPAVRPGPFSNPLAFQPMLPGEAAVNMHFSDYPLNPMRNQNRSFGHKILRTQMFVLPATAYILRGFLLAGPDVSHWEANPWKDVGHNLIRAWTSWPVFDHDAFSTNFEGHPYSGSFYYGLMRTQGESILHSFEWAFIQGAAHEYLWEAGFEQPSIQDLLATPIIGSLIGEGQFLLSGYLKDRFAYALRGHSVGTLAFKAILFVINPSDAVNNGFKPRHKLNIN